jgi:hypothetical protein
MPDNEALAQPAKRFFIALITRDITLEDAILDLIDNPINSALRELHFDLDRMERLLSNQEGQLGTRPLIDIHLTAENFRIRDNCGGISFEDARDNIFRIGRESSEEGTAGDTLSVYGIGLKRAIFKLGRRSSVTSHHGERAWEVGIDIDEWVKDDRAKWTFPLREISTANAGVENGTFIEVGDLYPEIKDKIALTLEMAILEKKISGTYGFLLNRVVDVRLNGRLIAGAPFNISSTAEVDSFDAEGCRVKIIAGVGARKDDPVWRAEVGGWYILCNGRGIVLADKTPRTGWGTSFLPSFVSKYRGFIGLVLFLAEDPERLPWTTTKTDINQESPVYQRALSRMATTAKPILGFLDSLYASSEVEADQARNAAANFESRSISDFVSIPKATFSPPRGTVSDTTKIQFDAKLSELENIRKHIRRRLSGTRIGRMCFDYYLKNEANQ